MGCILYENNEIFYRAVHDCQYIYNIAIVGQVLWTLFLISLAIGVILWFAWVTKVLIEYKQSQKSTKPSKKKGA